MPLDALLIFAVSAALYGLGFYHGAEADDRERARRWREARDKMRTLKTER
jgi:hypothetical protein